MALLNIKRARIRAALQSILRAATGRDIPRAELDNRTAAYLQAGAYRGLGPGDIAPSVYPLFVSTDYKPESSADPLGGPDGRDISRSWSAVREDLDTCGESLREASRVLNSVTALFRSKVAALNNELSAITLAAQALQSQTNQSFFGGSSGSLADGSASSVWNQLASQGLVYPQTTAIILSGALGIIPTLGNQIASSSTSTATLKNIGGTLAPLTLSDSSDQLLMLTQSASLWITDPFDTNPPAWSFTNTQWVDIIVGGSSSIACLEISLSNGTRVSYIQSAGITVPFDSLIAGGELWVVFSNTVAAGSTIRITFTGTTISDGSTAGAVYGIKAHSFVTGSSAQLVWGPFSTISSNNLTNDALFTVTLNNVMQSIPAGTKVDWGISTASPDGPFTIISDLTKPLVLGSNGRTELDLFNPVPDPSTLGYYSYPLSATNNPNGATFSAGMYQAKVNAFSFDWGQQRDIYHQPADSDWSTPKGTVNTVAMNAGPTYTGQLGTQQVGAVADFISAGSAIGSYTDDQDQLLTCINITGTDPTNPDILQPGYNYRFSWSLWVNSNASLTNLPVGLFNPGGTSPGSQALGFVVEVNGSPVYQTSSYFSNYLELSPSPPGFGSNPQDYAPLTPQSNTQGITTLTAPPGAAWPPYCGRMSWNLRPGWNTVEVLVYVPNPPSQLAPVLGPCCCIVFGPCLFSDPVTLYETTGIQIVRGWPEAWTQLSEFDLRNNTPLGMKEVWAWVTDTDSGGLTGLLLNHNPNASETGFLTLDNVLTGNARTHHISYLQSTQQTNGLIPGQDPLSQQVWVSATLNSSNTSTTPVVSSFTLTVN